MRAEDLIADLHHRAVTAIERDTLRELINAADVLREDDTHLAGRIRILGVGGSILVQEETPKGEVLVRRMPSLESAESFVNLRMQSYERMWNGCGCKVDYHAAWSDGPGDPGRRFRARGGIIRSPVVVLSILAVLAAPPIRADSPQVPQRFHASARWGTFEDMDSPVLLRKDGEPGNPALGWAGSQQAGAALGLEILPGLTLDVGYYRLEFDLGSDLVPAEPGSALETVRIATGDFEDLRFALWVSFDAFKDDAQYFVSPARPGRARLSVGFLAGFTKPSEVRVDDAARELLGIADVEADTSTSLGFGGRFDYRLGRSRFVAGAELDWLFGVSGDSLTVTTAPGSPYSGTVAEHEGLSFVLDLSTYF